ncbi:MAG TPA: hypothetical protein VIV11_18330 [Kofleriaceae bacterium]
MMRVIVRLSVGLSLVACGGPKPEPPLEPTGPRVSGATRPAVYRDSKGVPPIEFRCAEATKKAMPLFVELTKAHARPVVAKDLEVLTSDCGALKYDKQDQMVETDVSCLYEAKDDAALRACWAASLARPRDKTQAVRDLEHVARGLTAVIRREGAPPRGDVFPTPAIGCCARIGHRCRGSHSDTMLERLDINVEHTSYFQLAYQSDGVKVVVKAVGDLDCDGTTITYTLEGTAQGGELRYKIVEPTNPD